MNQPLTEAESQLVETAQMRIANQRLKLQQQQQARKAEKQ